MALSLRTRTPGARALLPATRSQSSGPLGALLSSPALDVLLMTALQVLQDSVAQHWGGGVPSSHPSLGFDLFCFFLSFACEITVSCAREQGGVAGARSQG